MSGVTKCVEVTRKLKLKLEKYLLEEVDAVSDSNTPSKLRVV